MEINSGELLEEMLRKGEHAVFPTLRNCTERFVDIFNDSKIQQKIREKVGSCAEFQLVITQCKDANTLFEKLKYLKQLLQDIEDKISESGIESFISRLLNTGFIGLITEENLDFLSNDDLDMTQRVDKFLHFLEHGTQRKGHLKRAFEEYITTWKSNMLSCRSRSEDEINKLEREMQTNFESAFKENKQFISRDELINEIAEKFEPLRHKLVSARNACVDSAVTAVAAAATAISAPITAPVEFVASVVVPIADSIIFAAGRSMLAVGFTKVLTGRPAITAGSEISATLSGAQTAGSEINATVPGAQTAGSGISATVSGAQTAGSGISAAVSGFFSRVGLPDAVSRRNAVRAITPGWYDNTKSFITQYLNNRKIDDELSDFIRKENLEPDLHHFQDYLDPWLIELNSKIIEFERKVIEKSYYVPKEMILKEIDRMRTFLYAVILNKPEMIEEHNRQLNEMMQDAAKLPTAGVNGSLLPSISFGQLRLPGGNKERVLSIKFVLSNSLDQQAMKEIMSKIADLFDNVKSSSKSVENGVTVIEIKIRTDDNISVKVARCISNLADLQVRAVLVGEFGLGGFRHAMNPAFNRIYSINAVDKAEGFMSTYFSGSLDRGGEPYFCPNGWRRYSIDVGLTGRQFEEKYKNWHVAYHGTEGHIAMAILLNGIRASGQGCFIKEGQEGAVYLSPSIEYSGHPRYAGIWQIKDRYVQMVLQVRVDRNLLFEKKHGTLTGAYPRDPPIDSNFRNNNELEWVIKKPPGTSISALGGILVYGIMLSVTDQHPKTLPQNAWWSKK